MCGCGVEEQLVVTGGLVAQGGGGGVDNADSAGSILLLSLGGPWRQFINDVSFQF
jgi:hypothetical protein